MTQPAFILATGRHAGTWLLQVSLYDKKSKVLFGHLGFLRYEGHRTGKKRGHSFRAGTRGSAKKEVSGCRRLQILRARPYAAQPVEASCRRQKTPARLVFMNSPSATGWQHGQRRRRWRAARPHGTAPWGGAGDSNSPPRAFRPPRTGRRWAPRW